MSSQPASTTYGTRHRQAASMQVHDALFDTHELEGSSTGSSAAIPLDCLSRPVVVQSGVVRSPRPHLLLDGNAERPHGLAASHGRRGEQVPLQVVVLHLHHETDSGDGGEGDDKASSQRRPRGWSRLLTVSQSSAAEAPEERTCSDSDGREIRVRTEDQERDGRNSRHRRSATPSVS